MQQKEGEVKTSSSNLRRKRKKKLYRISKVNLSSYWRRRARTSIYSQAEPEFKSSLASLLKVTILFTI